MSVRSAIGGIVGGVVGFFVGGPYGAAYGFAIGAGLGAYTDTIKIEGPKLQDAVTQTSTVGGSISFGSGTYPTSGNVIWIGPIITRRKKQKSGGKGGGGSETTVNQYFRSYAIGVSEAIDKFVTIKRNGKVVYSNDPFLPSTDVQFSSKFLQKTKLYLGGEDQMPDPTISAVVGAGNVSPFRGIAYIVVREDDLTDTLGAIPQFEFVVQKVSTSDDSVAALIRGVTLIPSTGESLYATTPSYVYGFGNGSNGKTLYAQNMHINNGKTDIVNSIEDLDVTLPNCDTVALVVSWFADDLRAGVCSIKPGYAQYRRIPRRYYPSGTEWTVQGFNQQSSTQYIHEITGSQTEAQLNVAYGATPSDQSIREAIRYLKSKGKRIIFYPFVLVDIPAGNNLPNPTGGNSQPVNPWRGRITCHPAPGFPGSPDGTSAAAAQINNFFDREMGFSRMIYHYINICKEAGGVDVFLIGSEMVGITKVRDSATTCPAAQRFRTLAAAAKTIPNCKVSYAADWSEYKGHQYGNGDLIFGLDPLWADSNIDFIGIDNYFPIADVRDTDPNTRIYDVDYLKSQIEGGELFDWYYVDRPNNIKANITDGAYNEPWVYRQKDIRSFWANQHYNRVGGIRQPTPTGWVPLSKPFWFTEYGCAAINRGPNQPNVFFDRNSSESSFPYFSTGVRDDNAQRAYIQATVQYWAANGGALISTADMVCWTWDVRPYPDFPLGNTTTVIYAGGGTTTQRNNFVTWADYPNYPRGHWLQGRLGGQSIGAEIANITERINLDSSFIDVGSLRGTKLSGYRIANEANVISILEPFQAAFFFETAEYDKKLHFIQRNGDVLARIPYSDLLPADNDEDDALVIERVQESELLRKLTLTAFDPTIGYATNSQTAERRISTIKATSESSKQLPLVLAPSELATIVLRRLKAAWGEPNKYEFKTSIKWAHLTETDVVQVEDRDGTWYTLRLNSVSEDGNVRKFEAQENAAYAYTAETEGSTALPPPATAPGEVGLTTLSIVDIPVQADQHDEYGAYLSVVGAGDGWTGAQIQFSLDGGTTIYSTFDVDVDSTAGNLVGDLAPWLSAEYPSDQSMTITLSETPASVSREVLLTYANKIAMRSASGAWEVLQFQTVVTNDDGTFTLSGLLRGRYNTIPGAAADGTQVVVIDEFLSFNVLQTWMATASLSIRAVSVGGDADDIPWTLLTSPRQSQTEWPPTNITTVRDGANNVRVDWIPRPRLGAEIAPRQSKYFTGYRVVFSDGAVIDTGDVTFTRSNCPPGVTVQVTGLNAILGPGTLSLPVGT